MPHGKVKVSMKKSCGIIQGINARYPKIKDFADFINIKLLG